MSDLFGDGQARLRDDVIDKIKELVGCEPAGLRTLLKTLSHPDVVHLAILYLQGFDPETRCLTYEPPWSCAREAEARYQNIRYGWLGGRAFGVDESWCENCARKVMEA